MADPILNIPLSKLADLAIEYWRLSAALAPTLQSAGAAPIRHALRKIEDFLSSNELETRTLDGHPYDPGLSARVIDTIEDRSLPANTVIVTQTLSPMILHRDNVVRPADVVIARNPH